jgi:hypothetical protein
MAVALIWCSLVFHLPYIMIPFISLGVLVVWLVVLWPFFTESILSVTGSVVIAVVTCGITFALGWFLVDWARARYLEKSGLNARRSDYAKGVAFKEETKPVPRGKVAVLEKTDPGAFDYGRLHFNLPRDLMATDAEEVDVVILIWYQEFEAGRYTNGAMAFAWKANVYCIDWRTKTVLDRTEFATRPPQQTNNPGQTSGGRPDAEVKEWMRKLFQ